jgi:hypothetical protein
MSSSIYGRQPAGTDRGKGPLKGTYTFEIKTFCDRQGQAVDIGGARLFGFSALGDNRRFEEDLGKFSRKSNSRARASRKPISGN